MDFEKYGIKILSAQPTSLVHSGCEILHYRKYLSKKASLMVQRSERVRSEFNNSWIQEERLEARRMGDIG